MSDSTFAYAYAGQVIAAGVVLPVCGLACVVLRFVARAGKNSRFGADDWLAVPAALFVTGMGICMVIGAARKVMGYPTPPSSGDPEAQVTEYLPGQELLEQLEYAFFICMILAYGLIKLSVIFFYRRVFAAGSGVFDVVSKTAIVIAVMWTLGFLLVQVFSCGSHFTYNWGSLLDVSYCVGGLPFLEGLMISDFITDFLVLFLPFPLAEAGSHWNSPARSLAASAARLVLQVQESEGGYTTKTDVFLTITSILYWSLIEAGIAVIAICLPTLQSLISNRGQGSGGSHDARNGTLGTFDTNTNQYSGSHRKGSGSTTAATKEAEDIPPLPQKVVLADSHASQAAEEN